MEGNKSRVIGDSDDSEDKKILLVCADHLKAKFSDLMNSLPAANLTLVNNDFDSVKNNIKGKHGLIGCPRKIFGPEILEIGDKLSWVHAGCAGVEDYIFPELINSDLTLTNGRIIQGVECADHAMALLLSLTRNIARLVKYGMNKSLPRPIELYKKNALVIGGGGIGLCIAERAAAFGLKVSISDIKMIPMLSHIEKFIFFENILDSLQDFDIVFISSPLNYLTRTLVDVKFLCKMKEGAYFINVSRGKIVDTDALLDAVNSGKLAGVGLDVTEPEPLPDGHALFDKENVVITPHIAGHSRMNRGRSFQLIKDNITRFINNLPLLNVVDKKLGF